MASSRLPARLLAIAVLAAVVGGAGQSVKVAARRADGAIAEATATFDDKGEGRAVLKFDQPPGRLHVTVGPADAAADELFDLQTLTFDVAARLSSVSRCRSAGDE